MKPLKIYIASSFDEAATCELLRLELEARGHVVPDIWWNIRTKDTYAASSDEIFYGAPLVQAIAVRHLGNHSGM